MLKRGKHVSTNKIFFSGSTRPTVLPWLAAGSRSPVTASRNASSHHLSSLKPDVFAYAQRRLAMLAQSALPCLRTGLAFRTQVTGFATTFHHRPHGPWRGHAGWHRYAILLRGGSVKPFSCVGSCVLHDFLSRVGLCSHSPCQPPGENRQLASRYTFP